MLSDDGGGRDRVKCPLMWYEFSLAHNSCQYLFLVGTYGDISHSVQEGVLPLCKRKKKLSKNIHFFWHTVYRKHSTLFYFRPFHPLSVGEFKTGQIPLSQIISLYTQLCLGEFKSRAKPFSSQEWRKYHGVKITL